MMSHKILRHGKIQGGDNHTRDPISDTGGKLLSSCVLIAADEASWCQTLCKLLHPAAVQESTSGQACSQSRKMYSNKKKKRLPTQTHILSVECHHGDAQLDPSSGHLQAFSLQ